MWHSSGKGKFSFSNTVTFRSVCVATGTSQIQVKNLVLQLGVVRWIEDLSRKGSGSSPRSTGHFGIR